MSKVATRNLTSYDFLKSVALALMIVDHLGYYFYPDQEWFRVFGRMCVPIWFFLIGYARSRDVGPALWAGMAILVLADGFAGIPLLPLNIIGSILVLRLTLDPLMRIALTRAWGIWLVAAGAIALYLPSTALWEYGTEIYIMAICGYLLRRRQERTLADPALADRFFAFSCASFIVVEAISFGFDGPQKIVLAAGTSMVGYILYIFRPAEYLRTTASLPAPAGAALRFTGRHTLFLYVVHLLVFKALAVWLEPERFTVMHWQLFSSASP